MMASVVDKLCKIVRSQFLESLMKDTLCYHILASEGEGP